VCNRFNAAGLPSSRRHVYNILDEHRRICPALRIGYRTVRFERHLVEKLIALLMKGGGK
jgi:hypothetical protein